jgi:hypothetical protein
LRRGGPLRTVLLSPCLPWPGLPGPGLLSRRVPSRGLPSRGVLSRSAINCGPLGRARPSRGLPSRGLPSPGLPSRRSRRRSGPAARRAALRGRARGGPGAGSAVRAGYGGTGHLKPSLGRRRPGRGRCARHARYLRSRRPGGLSLRRWPLRATLLALGLTGLRGTWRGRYLRPLRTLRATNWFLCLGLLGRECLREPADDWRLDRR